MLEAKAKDLALLRLRRDLLRYGPDVAPRFGLVDDSAGEVNDEEMEIAPEALSA
jgi:UV DNA damage endonuclease